MATILILQHSQFGPGRLGMTLRDHGLSLDIRRADRHAEASPTLPPDLDNIHGLVVLGGPQSVTQPPDWMEPEMALIRAAHAAELPVVGICLGHQLIARALGGTVETMDTPELGLCEVDVQVPGQTHAVLAGVPWCARLCQDHNDAVAEPPPGATVLMGSPLCKVQAFAIGLRTFGFQFHFESTRSMMLEMWSRSTDAMNKLGVGVEELKRQIDEHNDRSSIIANRLCLNLMTVALPAADLLAV